MAGEPRSDLAVRVLQDRAERGSRDRLPLGLLLGGGAAEPPQAILVGVASVARGEKLLDGGYVEVGERARVGQRGVLHHAAPRQHYILARLWTHALVERGRLEHADLPVEQARVRLQDLHELVGASLVLGSGLLVSAVQDRPELVLL